MFGFKTIKWNNDPNQQKLAAMLLEGAIYDASRGANGKRLDIREMITFTCDCCWSDKEASDRFAHAVSMLRYKVDPETYKAAKAIGLNLYHAYRS
jgi:hypothetical protein